MTGEALSLQEVLRQRQQYEFVGRDARLAEFGANLRLPPTDPNRRFIINIHGVAGVGKTFLTQQYRRLAESTGALCAYADEDCFDVVETMAAIAADFERRQVRMPGFEAQLATYRQRRHEMESDPKAPIGDLVTSTTVRMGMSMAKTVPVAGMAAEAVDPEAVAAQLNRLRAYLGQRFSRKADIDLLLTPIEVLTRAFVAGLGELAESRQVALFFDTFERTAPFLETWLLDLFAGKFGNLSANLVTTIAGQHPLSSGGWLPLRSLISTHPLEPFTEEEARGFLAQRGVSDPQVVKVIFELSGRVPMWLATLAENNPQEPGSVPDPSEGAVQRFLKWEPDESRRAVAKVGALPRRFNHDVLAAAVGEGAEVEELFHWLCGLPFVSRVSEHWRYHDAVRDPMLRLARTTSPQRWRAANQQLAEYFAAEREALDLSDEDGWDDSSWQNLLLEEDYHRLCAAPAAALGPVLEHTAMSTEQGVSLARRWSTMLIAAGSAVDAETVRNWGQRLTELLQGDDADDIAFLTELIERAPLSPMSRAIAIGGRGESHRIQQHLDQALADLDPAVEAAPELPRLRWWRALTLRNLKRYDEALTDLDQAAALDPDSGWTHSERGWVLYMLDRYQESLTALERALNLEPGDGFILTSRGITYRALQRYDEALADFDRAIELDPENVLRIAERGSTYDGAGRHQEALADFDRAIELDPVDDWALTQRGAVKLKIGRLDEASADLDRAIQLNPDSSSALSMRAFVHARNGRHVEALKDIDHVIALDESSSWNRFVKACVLWVIGKRDQSRREAVTAIGLFETEAAAEPDDPLHGFTSILYRAVLGEPEDVLRPFGQVTNLALIHRNIDEFLVDLDVLRSLFGIDSELVAELTTRVSAYRESLR